jgi:YD repeat-containing protein
MNFFRYAALILATFLTVGQSVRSQTVWDAGQNASTLSGSRNQTGINDQYGVDSMTGLLTRRSLLFTIKGAGASALDVAAVYRSYPRYAPMLNYNVSNFGMDSGRQFQPLGFGWHLHFGRLYFENFQSNLTNYNFVCSPAFNNAATVDDQPVFESADGSRRKLYRTQKLLDGRVTYVSTDFWQMRCPGSASPNFEVLSPSGEKYVLGNTTSDAWNDPYNKSALTYWTTRIEDPRGSFFLINYLPNSSKISSINSSANSVQANFSYVGTTLQTYRISEITYNNRSFTFEYQNSAFGTPNAIIPSTQFHLSKIKFPENQTESFEYHQTAAPVHSNVNTRNQLKKMILRYGEEISFNYEMISLPPRLPGLSYQYTNIPSIKQIIASGQSESHGYSSELGIHSHTITRPDNSRLISKYYASNSSPISSTQYGLYLGTSYYRGLSIGSLDRVENIEYELFGSPNNTKQVWGGWDCPDIDTGFLFGGINRGALRTAATNGIGVCVSPPENNGFRATSVQFLGAKRISDVRYTVGVQNYLNNDGSVTVNYAYSVDGIYLWLPKRKTVLEYNLAGQSSSFQTDYIFDNITANLKNATTTNPSGTFVNSYAHCNNFNKGIIGVPTSHTVASAGISASVYQASYLTTADATVCAPNQINEGGQLRSIAYHPTGDVGTVTDALGRSTVFSNHKLGMPQLVTRPDGTQMQSLYDDNGWQTSETSPDGFVTTFDRDLLGRTRQINHPSGSATTIAYVFNSASGRYTKTQARAGAQVITQLDGIGRPASIARLASGTSASLAKFSYTWAGQKSSETYRNSSQVDRVTSFTYDALGRLIGTNFPDGNNTTTEYSGTFIKTKDVRGFVTETSLMHYTGNPDQGLPSKVSNLSAAETEMTIQRDLLGRITALSQGGFMRSTPRNANGCVYSETHPELGTITPTPDAKCNTRSLSIPNSGIIYYDYDLMDRVKSATYPDGRVTSFTYWGDGKLKTANTLFNSQTVSRNLDYTPARKIKTNQLSIDGLSMVSSYAYDSRDELEEITYPLTGTKLKLNPDALGRPTALQMIGNGSTTSLMSNIQYFESGKIRAYTQGNGLNTTYTEHPDRAWPDTLSTRSTTSAGATDWLVVGHNFDAAGNVLRITDSRAGLGVSDRWHRYDAMQRLVGDSSLQETATANCVYCYDARNNITQLKTGASQAVSLNYGTDNRLNSVSGAASGAISYDARSNVTGDGFMRYAYDSANNLISVHQGTTTIATYTYDPKNQRAKKVVGQKAPQYSFYDMSLKPLIEWDRETNKISEFFYLNNTQISRRTSAPVPLTVANSSISVVNTFVSSNSQGTINIILPAGATGNVRIIDPAGNTIYSGPVTQGGINLPAGGLTQGCQSYSVQYTGGGSDISFAPGVIGQVRICKGVNLAPILQLLLDDDQP